MTAKDQLKVIKAGFIIIREDKEKLLIKAKFNDNKNWHTQYDGFKSYAELLRKKTELLKESVIIED